MDLRHGLLNGSENVEVGIAGEARVNPTLEAHLGATARPGFLDSCANLVEVQQIRLLGSFLLSLTLRERAKPAAVGADVCVVDIAVYDVRCHVTDHGGAKMVSCVAQRGELAAARF